MVRICATVRIRIVAKRLVKLRLGGFRPFGRPPGPRPGGPRGGLLGRAFDMSAPKSCLEIVKTAQRGPAARWADDRRAAGIGRLALSYWLGSPWRWSGDSASVRRRPCRATKTAPKISPQPPRTKLNLSNVLSQRCETENAGFLALRNPRPGFRRWRPRPASSAVFPTLERRLIYPIL